MLKCFKNVARNFVLRADMFAASASLRFNGETAYETIFGGLLSLAIVIAFAIVFYSSFLDVINKVVITATTDIETDSYNTIVIDDLTLAIGISGIDFQQTSRYFQIVLTHELRPLGEAPQRVSVALQSCNISNWKNLGSNFDKLFVVHEMEKMLCPKAGQDFALQGFAGSDKWQILEIRVEKCVNQSGLPWQCHSQSDIDSFISTYQQENDYFEVNIFVVDTVFTPLQSIFTQKVLQTDIFCSFSNNLGSRGKIKIGDYNITTDQSIWPFSENTQETGYYITDYRTHTVEIFSTHYTKLTIEKDQTVLGVERVHGKFDQMLSYVGGLFALLFGFIFFFIGSYSEYRYEIAVAESTFTMDQSGKRVKEGNFGFFSFLKYSLYDWMDSLGIPISWREMELVHKAREEAGEQMDTRLILKKLERAERVNELLLKERNLVCSYLIQAPTIQKIRKNRIKVQYYNKVLMKSSPEAAQSPIFNLFKKEEQQIQQFSESLQNLGKEDEQILSDFDSEDEEAEKQILMEYLKLKEDKNNAIGAEILSKIPKSMKKRLRRLQMGSKYQNDANQIRVLESNTVNNTQSQIHHQSPIQIFPKANPF